MGTVVRQIGRLQTIVRLFDSLRVTSVNSIRSYSVFPPDYLRPIFNKKDQALLEETGETERLAHTPFRPAFTSDTSSEFYDPVVKKFTNYMLRKGKKALARSVLEESLEKVKRMQLERYHKAAPENRHLIMLKPKDVLYKAIENVTPIMELFKMKKGGGTYQVPIPLLEKRQRFLAMNWLIRTAKEKDGTIPFSTALARELIDASQNQGRTVRMKQELHKQCEANRAYAHYRWS